MTVHTTPTQFPAPAGVLDQRITSVHHYTDRLFKFRVSRPSTFRFRSGEFVMIGLPNAAKPLFRAYSIASPAWDEELEFYSIKVADGPLTEHLQRIQPGDRLLLRPKTTGTLVLDALSPGKRLWMISTGTGIAPFASLMREPETYEKFEQVILTHACRDVAELAYGLELTRDLAEDPLVGESSRGKFHHYPATTRESFPRMGRITAHIADGRLFREFGLQGFDPEHDRVMICGSMSLNQDMRKILTEFGLREGANNAPAEFVVERAFVG